MTGAQLAIPAGTYVEGTIESVDKRGPSGPTLQIRFTRILFANGYTVSVDANNSQAQLIVPETDANSEIDAMNGTSLTNEMGEAAPLELASESEPHFSLAAFTPYSESQFSQTAQRSPAQSTGQPPPLHAPGPSIGTAVGISLGATAAVIVALVVLTHHGSNPSAALFDTGWQFDMILQGPLTLDGASVANAIAATVAQ